MNNGIFTASIAILSIFAVVLFAVTLDSAVFYAPEREVDPPFAVGPVAPTSSRPIRLQIPSIHVDAEVQQVGVTSSGAMGIPSNFSDVGWYKYGPVPGQIGSAVIDGHVSNGLALAGVFRHLSDIKVGDDVYVVAQDGSKLHFLVVDIESYPYDAAPTATIFGRSDAARLNLITCAGAWVRGKRTYDERLVVYTKITDIMKISGT